MLHKEAEASGTYRAIGDSNGGLVPVGGPFVGSPCFAAVHILDPLDRFACCYRKRYGSGHCNRSADSSASCCACGLRILGRGSGFLPSARGTDPLPEVRRATPVGGGSVFDRPAIVALVSIRQRCEVAETDMEDGLSQSGRTFMSYGAVVLGIVRVNERRPQDPDLAKATLGIDLREPRHSRIRLDPGKDYLLFLDPSPLLSWFKVTAFLLPPYVLGVSQGDSRSGMGGEPLVAGGELDQYRDNILTSLVREIRNWPK